MCIYFLESKLSDPEKVTLYIGWHSSCSRANMKCSRTNIKSLRAPVLYTAICYGYVSLTCAAVAAARAPGAGRARAAPRWERRAVRARLARERT